MNFVSQPEIDYMKNQVVCYIVELEGLSEDRASHCFVHFFILSYVRVGLTCSREVPYTLGSHLSDLSIRAIF